MKQNLLLILLFFLLLACWDQINWLRHGGEIPQRQVKTVEIAP